MPDDDLRKTRETLGSLANAVADLKRDAMGEHATLPGKVSQIHRSTLPEYPRRRAGAPTTYTPAIAELICDRLENGELLAQILAGEGMPARQVVHQWLANVPGFADRYARARSHQATALAERAVAEAWRDDLAPQDVNRAKLRYDSARWLAGKLDPQRWGDRTDVTVSVPDPDAQARAATQRAEVIAALQRLAVAAPLTIDARLAEDSE